jgi:phage gp29-like protein
MSKESKKNKKKKKGEPGPADRPLLLQQDVTPDAIGEEIAGPTMVGFRSIFSEHPARGLTPERLAALLLAAEQGVPRAYLELAEDIEERYPHYRTVLNTRRMQISQLDVTVTAGGAQSATDNEAAEMVRGRIVGQPWFTDLLFDLMDGIAKGYAVCEILWDPATGDIVGVPWRDPRWFRVDIFDGTTLRLEDGSPKGADLPLRKFVIHRPRTKSGIMLRGGLARPAAWLYLLANLTLKDWAIFVHTCGLPIRIGKYGLGTSKEDKAILMRAVRNIAGDAAAIIPDSMEISFERIKGEGGKGGDVWERLVAYCDQQASKLVLGQTATTDAIAGGHAVGKEHNDVRSDIERSDARQLAATVTRDLVAPFIAYNCPRAACPVIQIGRPEQIDLGDLADAVDKLVGAGLKLDAKEVRKKAGFSDPAAGAEVLEPGQGAPPPVVSGLPALPGADVAAALHARQPETTASDDAIDQAVAALLADDGWRRIAEPLADPALAAVRDAPTLPAARDRLLAVATGTDPRLVETLARLLAAGHLAGLGGAPLEPDFAVEPGREPRR